MIDLTTTWKRLLADLERERDTLRLKAHLGKAEARELLVATEEKLYQFRLSLAAMSELAKESAKQVETRMQKLADELRALFGQIQDIV